MSSKLRLLLSIIQKCGVKSALEYVSFWRFQRAWAAKRKTALSSPQFGRFRSTTRQMKHINNNSVLYSLPKTAILLPVYNAETELKLLLSDLQSELSLEEVTLYITDDASTSEAIWPMIQNFADSVPLNRVVMKRNITNLGYLSTVNSLAWKAIENGEEQVVFLNSDTRVPHSLVQRLTSHMHRDTNVATVTAMTNSGYLVGFPDLLASSYLPNNLTGLDVDAFIRKLAKGMSVELPFGIGHCMLAKAEDFVAMNGFDRDFKDGYGEEIDFCLKLSEQGKKHLLACDIFVEHYASTSFGKKRASIAKKKNSIILLKKHPRYLNVVKKYLLSDPLFDLSKQILDEIHCDQEG